MSSLSTIFTKKLDIEFPIIGGAMYPCSNPELVSAVSDAGGIGIVQPLSLTFVHGHEFRAGIRLIRKLTSKPIGLNLLIESSSKTHLNKMRQFMDQALEEGIRFFITALGNPKWFAEKIHSVKGIVYHDITNRRWADKAHDAGVDGLICVNSHAGGHAGQLEPESLYREVKDLGLPLVCAGGIGNRQDFIRALELGYAAVQLGTRFLASNECKISDDYKNAIVGASANDIVLTERLTGVPVAIINTESVRATGTKAGFFAKWLLRHPRGKHWVRTYYSLKSFIKLRNQTRRPNAYRDYWQAGKSVEHIDSIKSVADIFKEFTL